MLLGSGGGGGDGSVVAVVRVAGVDWPGDELALLGVIAFFALLSFLFVRALRRVRVGAVTAGAGA